MKRFLYLSILVLSFFSLQSCIVSAKPSIDFFNTPQYRNTANFTSINVPTFLAKSYLKGQLKEDGESQEVIDLVKKVSKVRMMTSENINASMMKDFSNYLNQENYEEWMTIKNEDNIIKINAQQKEELISKLMIVVNSGENAVFVDITGKFTADDISKIINIAEKDKVKIKL